MDHSFSQICYKFLQLNKVCVDFKLLKKQLYCHASYPSLKSLTDILSDLEISHRALKINREELREYGTPVLLHYNGNKPQFIIATHITDDKITYYRDNLKKDTTSLNDFYEHWNGAALYVFEPEKQSKICWITEIFTRWRNRLSLLATIILLFFIIYINPLDINFSILLILKICGLLFSFFLVRHDLGIRSNTERHICTMSKKINCTAVLQSSASKLFGMIKMSDIGIVYFSGGIIVLIISLLIGMTKSVESIFAIFSFCSIPYIIFSLSYQNFKVKKWCPFCLGVISVLLMEIIYATIFFNKLDHIYPSFYYIIVLIVFFIWLALLWGQIYGYIKSAMKADDHEIRFFALKRNFSVFEMMLDRQPAINMMFSKQDIMFGQSDIPFIITVAINPYCTPCLDLLEKLFSMLEKRPKVFRLNIRFMCTDEEVQSIPIGLILISIYFQNKEHFLEAFKFWKKDKNFLSFENRYDISNFQDSSKQALETHLNWRKMQNINHTPMIFVNNKKLPKIYLDSDLLYFLQYRD